MNNKTKHRALSSIRWTPFISAAGGFLACFMLSFECSTLSDIVRAIFEISVITAGFWIVYVFSQYLCLCLLQRLGIYYTYLVFVCMWLLRYPNETTGVFIESTGANYDAFTHYSHMAMAAIGIIYLIVVIYFRFPRSHSE